MADPPLASLRQSDRLVIAASSLGTIFEWYDFYLYGLLAAIISAQFFSGVNETTGFIFALAAFAAGFAVRPFGAILFGRIGDLVGRKIHLPGHDGDHGLVDLRRRPAAELCRRRASPRRSCWWRCACSRVSRWAANMAAPRPMSPSTRRRAAAASTPASSRPPRRSACSLALSLSSPPHLARRGGVRGLGLAASLPALDPPARRLALDPDEA